MSFISKKIQLLLPRFFPFKAYFCEAIMNKKKWGSPSSFHRKRTTKGQFRLQMIILCEGTEFQDKHLFSQLESSKLLLKALGQQKGP